MVSKSFLLAQCVAIIFLGLALSGMAKAPPLVGGQAPPFDLKTTSGKVQRRLLGDAYSNGDYVEVLSEIEKLTQSQESITDENLTPLQQELKTFCDSVIETGSLGVNDNFFESGISSLTLAEIHQQIDDRYPGIVDVVDLFEYQTIIELAEFMQEKL